MLNPRPNVMGYFINVSWETWEYHVIFLPHFAEYLDKSLVGYASNMMYAGSHKTITYLFGLPIE